jgi:hypothetical protein
VEIGEGGFEGGSIEVGPHAVGEIKLGVSGFPEQEVG